MIFQHFPHTNVWERKFDLAVKRSKVNLRSLFEQNWKTLGPRWYIVRFSLKDFLVLEKKTFKCFFVVVVVFFFFFFFFFLFCFLFTIYGHGGHLVQWRKTIRTNIQYPFNRKLHVKFGENCSNGIREEEGTNTACSGIIHTGYWTLWFVLQTQLLGMNSHMYFCTEVRKKNRWETRALDKSETSKSMQMWCHVIIW